MPFPVKAKVQSAWRGRKAGDEDDLADAGALATYIEALATDQFAMPAAFDPSTAYDINAQATSNGNTYQANAAIPASATLPEDNMGNTGVTWRWIPDVAPPLLEVTVAGENRTVATLEFTP